MLRSKIKAGSVVFDAFNYIFMFLFSLIVIYPFWNIILISFSDQKAATSLGFTLWNSNWYTDAYQYLFLRGTVFTAYYNTIFRTVIGSGISLLFILLAAYPLSKRALPFRNYITMYFLIPMFFGGGLIPTYLLIRSLGLIDKIWVLIIPGIMNIFNVIIMRNFLMAMDEDLEEAAYIDGANYLTILFRIVAPLCKPVLATVLLWNMVGHWNAWFDALIYTRNENLIVLQLYLRRLIAMESDEMNPLKDFDRMRDIIIPSAAVKSAAIVVSIGPIVLAYPFLQKYFVKGIMVGSLKG